MIRRHLRPAWLVVALATILLGPLALAPSAIAQTMLGVDPYRPYNSGYIPFSVPPPPTSNYNALEQSRYDNSTRANQMGAFYEELYGSENAPDATYRRAGPGVSYSDASRRNAAFKRLYEPDSDDAKFYEAQKRRSKEYFNALHEPDPRKRAEMLRAIERQALDSSRSLGPNARNARPSAVYTPDRAPARPSELAPPDAAGTTGPGLNAPRSPSNSSTSPGRAPSSLNRTYPGTSATPLADPLNRAGLAPTNPATRPDNPSRNPYYDPSRRLSSPYLNPDRRLASPFRGAAPRPPVETPILEPPLPPR